MAKCRLLAVDVDGTLLDAGRMDQADIAALHDAACADVVVCLCTGRAWMEVQPIWASRPHLPQPHCAGHLRRRVLVAEAATGRTLYSRPFDRPTADDLARAMLEMEYPVMALVDAWREGFDYHLLGQWSEASLYRRFFDNREGLRTRATDRLDRADGPRILRISLLTEEENSQPVARRLGEQFEGRIEVQSVHLRHRDLHIVEAFRAGTNKFSAMVYVGQGYRIGPGEMAAIGDDHNDLAMLRGVQLAATTADAPEPLREAADLVLAPRGRRPVAEFVEYLLRQG